MLKLAVFVPCTPMVSCSTLLQDSAYSIVQLEGPSSVQTSNACYLLALSLPRHLVGQNIFDHDLLYFKQHMIGRYLADMQLHSAPAYFRASGSPR